MCKEESFGYDATGQQTYASGTSLTQSYDGDGLRVKKTESGATKYYLRSTVLGGQVIAEIDGSGAWTRGYVYLGGQLVAVQAGGVSWVHQDPVTKSQRVTDNLGNVISTVDLDPWGGETWRSSNAAFQPHRYTSYERDANGGDEAMMRYQSYWNRFSQPLRLIALQLLHVSPHGFAQRLQIVAPFHARHDSPGAAFVGPLLHDARHLHKVRVAQQQLPQRITFMRIETGLNDDQVGAEFGSNVGNG